MKSNYYILLTALVLIFVSCKSGSGEDTVSDEDTLKVVETDTNMVEQPPMDTAKVDEVYKDPEVLESHKKIVEKYGTQWDFCTCILKSDSVNKALLNASDSEFDRIMERSDYIDNKCKGMLILPNSTPEERLKHEKKVKKCLTVK
ncbi:MAG: hypothetical protein R3277_12955 [Brumimicrobium sp.]|nr:hypothetical protein [Brumimicrobium sp.]